MIPGSERIIVIDDLLTAPVFLASVDEAKAHFEYRGEYSKQCGIALSVALDKNLAQLIALAARAPATVTGGNGGTKIINATARTNSDSLIASIADAAQALDEKDVPEAGRYVALNPDMYYQLLTSGSRAIHRDFNPQGNGSVRTGEVMQLFGMEVVKSNNLPTTLVNTGPTAYQGDFTNTAALAWQQSAVGTVRLVDLAVEMEYQVAYQGTLIVAKYALGSGILRPESAVEIAVA